MEIIFKEMDKRNPEFTYVDILKLFEEKPELMNINKDVENIAVAGRSNNE